MNITRKIAVLLLSAFVTMACQGPNDPYFIVPEEEQPGGNNQDNNYERVEVGTIRLFADKTSIADNGSESVRFTVIYGSEDGNVDISTAGTTRLVYTFEGEEVKMAYGEAEFSSSVAGDYTFSATAYRGGLITSTNQVVITVGGESGGNSEPSAEGYTIAVDKTTIEANGTDKVTFSVLDKNGTDLTENELSSIYFKNVATGERLDRKTMTFSSVINGNYEFVATYRGEETTNSVTIKVQNRAKYEKYKQRVAIYQLTGTWCTYCPQMVTGLEGISDVWKEHSLVMAVHASSADSPDPYALATNGSDLGNIMLGAFGGEGFPSCVYDLNELNGDRTASTISKNIESYLVEHPATCGVKIASTKREGSTITINASVTSSTGGTYDLGYAILLDNQTYSSGTSLDGKYHDIVCSVSGNFLSMSSDTKMTLAANEEQSRTFTIEGFPERLSTSDLRVAVFALSSSSGRTITDNLAVCKLGESVDYILN